ncbi:crotonase/enoyl-CoA hydratase family protein [Thalassotalea atypica]|uniref:crotonase/enoyl-CoA hydratase family protein n=1 Tax=Thalassotalea atypica TaxID=2054316 RepID=UPI002574363C|nr:crotonase/enoyl-CoA hydratase family protein [Thalassotalea atypica]
MTTKRITLSVEDNVARVLINRPDKHNAIDMQMFEEIKQLIKKLKRDKSLRAVVVAGEGESFCSGIDVKSALGSKKNAAKLLFKWLPGQANLAQFVSTGWREIPCPVIMVIHGKCWGGGLQIALGGDFRIADADAKLSILEARWGLIPDMGGSLALREQMVTDKAKYLAMTGKELSAEQALSYNLVTEVSDKPLSRALSIVNDIKMQSPDSVAGVKKLYNQSTWRSQAYALAKESWYQIKIIMGKNQRIKTYNQIHDADRAKPFKNRKTW